MVEHSETNQMFRVGCVCAEKMTSDYINPVRREKDLRNKASRRGKWLKRKWKKSANGNAYLNLNKHIVGVVFDKKTEKYKCRVDGKFGTKTHSNIKDAKMALFKNIEYLKDNGKW